jgi:hypothetical protein
MIRRLGIGLLIGLGVFARAAQEGVDHGSGGNVLHCAGGQPEYQLLDYYEGRVLLDLTEDLGSGADEWAMVANVLTRYQKVDAYRAGLYQGWVAQFRNEWRMLVHTPLTPVDDYGYIQLPTGCSVKQVILQYPVEVPEDGRYYVDEDTWNELDTQTKAGLILHEVIYRDAIRRGQEDSMRARYMTALVSSSQLATLTSYGSRVHTKLYDTYIYNDPYGRQVRYYDWKSGTFDQIQTYCRQLGPDADLLTYEPGTPEGLPNLWTGSIAVRGMNSSKLGLFISQIQNQTTRWVWVKGNPDPGRILLDRDLGSFIAGVGTTVTASALCILTPSSDR